MSTSSSISAWTLKTPASTPSTSGWTPARGSSTCRRPIPAGAQSGVLDDENGRRLVSVTPVGGTSGTAVYLLEAGILTSNLDAYTASYLRTYVVVSLLFLAAIGALLTFLFRRVLTPIRQIRAGLEAFAQGDRTVRLETAVTDEFSGIVRVFNKMAGDIDAQLYSLRRQSETYFRFIPQRMLQLLGKDNLGEVELGSGSGRECPVLCADLEFSADGLSPEREQELTNRFFNLLNRAADRCGATLMTDSVNLHRLRVICPGGAADAVEIALAVLTEVENLNAGCRSKTGCARCSSSTAPASTMESAATRTGWCPRCSPAIWTTYPAGRQSCGSSAAGCW